jgi:plastocyanin
MMGHVMERHAIRIAGSLLILTGLVTGTMLSACDPPVLGSCTPKGAGSSTASSTVQVVADPNTVGIYKPDTVTIPAGQSVTWAWADPSNQHSVTADDGTFDSCLQKAGATFTVTFSKPGTYTYKCSIHPHMTGRITVT